MAEYLERDFAIKLIESSPAATFWDLGSGNSAGGVGAAGHFFFLLLRQVVMCELAHTIPP